MAMRKDRINATAYGGQPLGADADVNTSINL